MRRAQSGSLRTPMAAATGLATAQGMLRSEDASEAVMEERYTDGILYSAHSPMGPVARPYSLVQTRRRSPVSPKHRYWTPIRRISTLQRAHQCSLLLRQRQSELSSRLRKPPFHPPRPPTPVTFLQRATAPRQLGPPSLLLRPRPSVPVIAFAISS